MKLSEIERNVGVLNSRRSISFATRRAHVETDVDTSDV